MNAPTVLALTHHDMMAGCTAWRIAWPMTELARRGYPVGWGVVGDPRSARWIDQADIIVAPRLEWRYDSEADGRAWVDLLHQRGKALIYETDDDLYSPESIDRIRITGDPDQADRPWAMMEAERQARIFALALADGVTVSTPALAAVVRRYTDKPIAVVPNAIDLPRFRAAVATWGAPRADRPLTIGWAGGNRPGVDAQACADAWGVIADRYPEVRFLVVGYPLGTLLSAVPPTRLQYVAKLSIHRYPAAMAEIDILCCPLEANTFNLSKSPIKAYEGAAAGSAVVASPTVYGDLITPGRDGLVCTTADDWAAALASLVDDRALRRRLAAGLLATVERDHTLAGNVHRWPAAWSDLVAAFRVAALRGRPVPDATMVGGPHG